MMLTLDRCEKENDPDYLAKNVKDLIYVVRDLTVTFEVVYESMYQCFQYTEEC